MDPIQEEVDECLDNAFVNGNDPASKPAIETAGELTSYTSGFEDFIDREAELAVYVQNWINQHG